MSPDTALGCGHTGPHPTNCRKHTKAACPRLSRATFPAPLGNLPHTSETPFLPSLPPCTAVTLTCPQGRVDNRQQRHQHPNHKGAAARRIEPVPKAVAFKVPWLALQGAVAQVHDVQCGRAAGEQAAVARKRHERQHAEAHTQQQAGRDEEDVEGATACARWLEKVEQDTCKGGTGRAPR